MSDHDVGEPQLDAGDVASKLESHVEDVMSAAREAAAKLQSEVERAAAARVAEIEAVAARRAHQVRMQAEADAQRERAQTREALQQYVSASRRLVDDFAKERIRRIREVSDELLAESAALVGPLRRSEDLARHVEELRATLGAACERIVGEASRPSPALADPPEPPEPRKVSGDPRREDAAAEHATPQSLKQRLARATAREQRAADGAESGGPDGS